MHNRQRTSLLVLGALTACGGGGSSGGSGSVPVVSAPAPMPSASPSPSPSPSPSTTPSPTYPTFASLSGDQRYAGACVGYVPRDNRAPFYAGQSLYSRSGTISYTAATQTFRVYTPNNVTQTFTPADAEAGLPAGTMGFVKASFPAYPGQERFRLIQPRLDGVPTDYARSAYINIAGAAIANGAGTFARSTGYCTLGVPTVPTDIPAASIVPFTRFAVTGEALDNRSGTLITYSLTKSTATLNVDLTTGIATGTLTLIGTLNGTDTTLGSFNLSADLDATTAGFLLRSTPVTDIAALAGFGGFYGPQGKEFGYAFSRVESVSGDPRFVIVGTVTGAR